MESKKRSPLIVIVFALVIGVAVIALLAGTIRPMPVLVAKSALAPGTLLTADLVETVSIPAGGVPKDAVTSLDALPGKMLTVGRAKGDFITTSVLGETAASGIPSQLAPGHVAVAIKVNLSSGVAGLLREGQTVTVIGMLSPDLVKSEFATANSAAGISAPSGATDLYADTPAEPAAGTPTPEPVQAPVARIAVTGLRVLLVPQTFRYQELPPSSSSNEQMFASAQSTNSNSVIVLDIPTQPVELAPGLFVNPATLIAALDEYGKIHLALEPADGLAIDQVLTLNLGGLYTTINKPQGQ